MHVNAKRVAFLGILLAFNELLLVLGCIIEVSTLFFIAAGAFCVGIAVREYGIKMGAAYLTSGMILGLLVVPNKMYCITYFIMSLYIVACGAAEHLIKSRTGTESTGKEEYLYNSLYKKEEKTSWLLWVVRYMIFNILYIPMVVLFPALFFEGKVQGIIMIAVIIAGEAGLFVFEKAYSYFDKSIWSKIRKRVMK